MPPAPLVSSPLSKALQCRVFAPDARLVSNVTCPGSLSGEVFCWSFGSTTDELRNVKRFRGGLVSKAHRRVYHSTLGWRVIKKKKKICRGSREEGNSWKKTRDPHDPNCSLQRAEERKGGAGQAHPGVELRANLKSISHRCHEVAFVRVLTTETIHVPLGCLQGGSGSARAE